MNELLDRAKVIHNEQVLFKVNKPTKDEILKKEAEDRLTSSRRIKEFLRLMKKDRIPNENFWGCVCWNKGWVVREPYYFDNDRKSAYGIAIFQDYSAVYYWHWSEDGKSRELSGFSQDSLFFSRESNFIILCERIIELKIV